MWAFRMLFADRRGTIALQYLILALILGGIAVAVAAGVTGALRSTHNSAVESVLNITGSGF